MNASLLQGTIGFLGFGNMGGAIARGLAAQNIVPADRILIRDPHLPIESAAALVGQGYRFAESESRLFRESAVVVIAVKPQTAKAERENWKALFASFSGEPKVFISIMAGIQAAFLRDIVPPQVSVVRVMPNLGLSVGQGATAIAQAPDENAVKVAQAVFRSCGATVVVDEAQMDAVTAVSGSGPMYVFEFIEAMTQAGEKAGLSREVSYELVRQTIRGSLELLKPLDGLPSASPDEWSARVRSPGGTTAAAQDVLHAGGFRALLERAVAAAKARSIELS